MALRQWQENEGGTVTFDLDGLYDRYPNAKLIVRAAPRGAGDIRCTIGGTVVFENEGYRDNLERTKGRAMSLLMAWSRNRMIDRIMPFFSELKQWVPCLDNQAFFSGPYAVFLRNQDTRWILYLADQTGNDIWLSTGHVEDNLPEANRRVRALEEATKYLKGQVVPFETALLHLSRRIEAPIPVAKAPELDPNRMVVCSIHKGHHRASERCPYC